MRKQAVIVGSVRKTLSLRCLTCFWMRLLVPQRLRLDTLFWNLQLHQSFSCWTSNLSEDVANSKYSKISELFFLQLTYTAIFCRILWKVDNGKDSLYTYVVETNPFMMQFFELNTSKRTLIGWMMSTLRCFLKILFEKWKIHK